MSLNNGGVIDEADFVGTSSGAGDSGKVNKLNAAGKNPAEFVEFNGVAVHQNAGTTVNTSIAAVAFQTEDFDTDVFHDNTTNNSRLTVPSGKAGKYHVNGSIHFGSGTLTMIQIRKNGSTSIAQAVGPSVNASNTGASVSAIVDLAVGDYIELFAIIGSGSVSTSGDTRTSFSMYRIAG